MTSMLTLLPLMIVIFLILTNHKTWCAMTAGAACGIGISCIFTKMYPTPFCVSDFVCTVATQNVTTLISIYVLSLLMYIITESTAICSLSYTVRRILKKPKQIICSVPVLGTLLSQDDYMACMAAGTIITPSATAVGFSRELVAFLINLTAISVCCISPLSSWNPVIKNALISSHLAAEFSYLTIPANLTVIMFGITIGWLCLNVSVSANSRSGYIKRPISHEDTADGNRRGCFCLLAVFSTLITFFVMFTRVDIEFSPLTLSGIITCGITAFLFIQNGLIDKQKLKDCFYLTASETTPLVFTLLSIWSFITILNQYLDFDQTVFQIFEIIHVTDAGIPAVVFGMAAAFSFFTGSAYGSFSLFISMAANVSAQLPGNMKILTVSAAIAGSLFAVFSFSSDTTLLCSDKTGCNLSSLRALQFSYGIPIFFVELLGYVLLGTAQCQNLPYYMVLPLCILAYLLVLSGWTFLMKMEKAKGIWLYKKVCWCSVIMRKEWEDAFSYSMKLSRRLLTLEYYFRRKQMLSLICYHNKCPGM